MYVALALESLLDGSHGAVELALLLLALEALGQDLAQHVLVVVVGRPVRVTGRRPLHRRHVGRVLPLQQTLRRLSPRTTNDTHSA